MQLSHASTPELSPSAPLESASSVGKTDALSSVDSSFGPFDPAFAATSASVGGGTIRQTTVLRHLPETPGEFEAEVTFAVPDSLTRLETTLEPEAEVVSREGFDRVGENRYEWTASSAETDQPRLAFRMPANRTELEHRDERPNGDRDDERRAYAPAPGTDDGYSFVDTGEWAVVPVPQLQLRYGWRGGGDVSVDRTVEIDGPGATGGSIAFFGAIDERYERTAATGETIELVVPAVADLRESPDAILETLAHASETLRVGAPNDETFFVAVPGAGADWAANGIQYGDGDAWVTDDSRLDVAHNVWVHEYVHTRQDFAKGAVGTAAETRWLTEAQAEYYAALVTLERGEIEYQEFHEFLADGRRSPYADGTLADRTTWKHPQTDYVKGALVYGAIDRQLRLATDGAKTGQSVFRELNLHAEPVTEAAFLSVLEDVGGTDVRAFAERYTRTAETPDVWSPSEHRAAFAQETAIVVYGLGDDPIELTGPYRGGPISFAVDAIPAVVPGETIAFPVTAENIGERSGSYRATLQVDGRVVDSRNGTLEAGGRVPEVVSWTPESPGRYDLRVGDRRVTVEVSSFASGRVTDLEIDPESVDPGDAVTLIATVENPDDVPAERTIRFRTPYGVADERTVTLAPGETTAVETTVSFDDPGRYEVAVDDYVRTVTVERADVVTEAKDAVNDLPTAGFGFTAALLALAVAVGLALDRIRAGAGRRRR